jgi:hypothetical protein
MRRIIMFQPEYRTDVQRGGTTSQSRSRKGRWRMRRFMGLITVVLLMALMVATAGPASAISENAAERACVGAFVSTGAKEAQPFGQTIRQEAKDFHPFGKTASQGATTCELPG